MSVVIVNPSSASGSTGEAWPQIASDLRSQFGAFRVLFTKHRGDAAALANEAARKGAKLIIACGGDGTISEVANGILSSGKDVELGILPSGTGAISEEHSRSHRELAMLPEFFATAALRGSTSVEFHTSIKTAVMRRDISSASRHVA